MKISQNQYINKSKNIDNKNRSNNIWEFKYTGDVSNGYVQSQNLCLFNGVSEEMDCGGNSTFEYAYFLLTNPVKSNINIYVKNSIITNLSSNPIITKVYYCVEDVVGNMESSSYISITNSNSSGTMPKGKIFFGNDMDKIYGTYGQNLIISPFSMYNAFENGSIVISPGFSYMFEVSPINQEVISNFVMSFSWWEEPFSSYMD